ncbi:MAG: response regulator transcription factor [Elusimicrobiota bacterium]
MKKILVVDDDKEIRELIAEMLKKEGFSSVLAKDADDCFKKLEDSKNDLPDMILMDLNLPGVSGWDVCKILKKEKEYQNIPVIIITGHYKTATDTVFGFQHGVDDYVTKPFNPAVLLARIKAILRRSNNVSVSEQEMLSSSDKKIVVDVNNRTVKLFQKKNADRNGGCEILDLTPKEFDLLCLFLRKPNRVLSKEQISQIVWQQDYFDTSRTIGNHIIVLRKKLGCFGERIVTITSFGYKFIDE